ncbi:hypothetical protein [Streptomyces sp. NPDC047043]|uniref:hypothetical protein n=1 Tax=Streptomyces sp. NPDC047043 TaxID=3154497 RepID=UPI0033F272F4
MSGSFTAKAVALYRYPVKSMLGERLKTTEITDRISALPGRAPEPCAGVYAQVVRGGRVREGDAVRV